MKLEGKTAVVTGASSGIGAATVRALRAEGARVAGGARRVEQIDADIALPLDVTDPASCDAFVEQAIAGLGGLDVLVNGAGLALGRDPFDVSTEADEEAVLATNVQGLVRMTRLCLPHLRDGGHIVNLGSIAGIAAYPNGTLYVTSNSRCTASPKRCARICSAARSGSRTSHPDWWGTPSSRRCASAATRKRPARSTRTSPWAERSARGRRRLHPLRAHAAPERERRRDRASRRSRSPSGAHHPRSRST